MCRLKDSNQAPNIYLQVSSTSLAQRTNVYLCGSWLVVECATLSYSVPIQTNRTLITSISLVTSTFQWYLGRPTGYRPIGYRI